jgi:hypothetical protein
VKFKRLVSSIKTVLTGNIKAEGKKLILNPNIVKNGVESNRFLIAEPLNLTVILNIINKRKK